MNDRKDTEKKIKSYSAELKVGNCDSYYNATKSTVNNLDDTGETLLHAAIEAGHSGMVDTCLRHEADVYERDKLAATKGHFRSIILALENKTALPDTDYEKLKSKVSAVESQEEAKKPEDQEEAIAARIKKGLKFVGSSPSLKRTNTDSDSDRDDDSPLLKRRNNSDDNSRDNSGNKMIV